MAKVKLLKEGVSFTIDDRPADDEELAKSISYCDMGTSYPDNCFGEIVQERSENIRSRPVRTAAPNIHRSLDYVSDKLIASNKSGNPVYVTVQDSEGKDEKYVIEYKNDNFLISSEWDSAYKLPGAPRIWSWKDFSYEDDKIDD
jgi:hypothetical protein